MPLVNSPIQTDYKATGASAGILADQQWNDWQNQQARDFQTQDINNAMNQNTLDNALLDNPVKAAQRSVDIGQKTNDLANQGVKNAADLAKYASETSNANLKVAENRADLTRSFAMQMEGLEGPAKAAMFEKVQSEAKKHNLQFDSPEDLQAKGQAAASFQKIHDQLKLQGGKIEGEKEVARIQAQGHVDAAGKNVLAAQISKEAMAPRVQQLSLELTRKENSGQPFTPEDVAKGMEIFHNNKSDWAVKMSLEKLKIDTQMYISMATKETKKYAAKAIEYGLKADAPPQDLAKAIAQRDEDEKALAFVKTSWPKGMSTTGRSSTPIAKEAAPAGIAPVVNPPTPGGPMTDSHMPGYDQTNAAPMAPPVAASMPGAAPMGMPAAAAPQAAPTPKGLPPGAKMIPFTTKDGRPLYELNGKRYAI